MIQDNIKSKSDDCEELSKQKKDVRGGIFRPADRLYLSFQLTIFKENHGEGGKKKIRAWQSVVQKLHCTLFPKLNAFTSWWTNWEKGNWIKSFISSASHLLSIEQVILMSL